MSVRDNVANDLRAYDVNPSETLCARPRNIIIDNNNDDDDDALDRNVPLSERITNAYVRIKNGRLHACRDIF